MFMKIYTGIDIIEIEKFTYVLENNNNFITKIFTKNELVHFNNINKKYEHLAGKFACKEALIKMFSSYLNINYKLSDFEILKLASGKPYVNILNTKIKKYETNIDISISHSDNTAIAIANLLI